MKFIVVFLCLFLSLTQVEAGSVRLVNDSPYMLRAVIRSNDNTYLGELVVNAQQTSTWSDNFLLGNVYRPSRSQTPYTIVWYCMDGRDYGLNANVPTGYTASAQSSNGAKVCGAIPPPPPTPNQTEEYLQPQQSQGLQEGQGQAATTPPNSSKPSFSK